MVENLALSMYNVWQDTKHLDNQTFLFVRQMTVQEQDKFLYTAVPPLSFCHSFYMKAFIFSFVGNTAKLAQFWKQTLFYNWIIPACI